MTARAVAAIGAVVGAAGLALQYWLILQDMREAGALAAAWRFFAYFTILTNALVTIVMARAALAPADRTGFNAPSVELMGLTSILFVCAVYNLLLASRWHPQGLQLAADIGVHQVTPAIFAIFWVLRPHGGLRWRAALFCALWPIGYAAYGLARGAVDGFYPYFFMDPSTTPWRGVAANLSALTLAFVLGALAIVGFDRFLARRGWPQN